MFHTYVARVCSKCFSCLILMLQEVFYCCKCLSGCCICFTHMLQVYVRNVSSASDLFCIQVFHVASVSCFRDVFRESWGHGPSARGRGVVNQGSADGAHSALRDLRMGRARLYPGSWVPPAQREKVVRGKERRAQPGCTCGARRGRRERDMHAGRGKTDRTSGRAHMLWTSGRL
jgi:hypothetical protein